MQQLELWMVAILFYFTVGLSILAISEGCCKRIVRLEYWVPKMLVWYAVQSVLLWPAQVLINKRADKAVDEARRTWKRS